MCVCVCVCVLCAIWPLRGLRLATIVSLYKDKGERAECRTNKGIGLSSVGGKIYVDKIGSFKSGKGCVDQFFTLKQIGEKARQKKT